MNPSSVILVCFVGVFAAYVMFCIADAIHLSYRNRPRSQDREDIDRLLRTVYDLEEHIKELDDQLAAPRRVKPSTCGYSITFIRPKSWSAVRPAEVRFSDIHIGRDDFEGPHSDRLPEGGDA